MTATRTLMAAMIGCLMLSACIRVEDNNGSVFRHFSYQGDQVVVHAAGKPDAVVRANGELSIDGKAVPVTAAQQALLAAYHKHAVDLRSNAVATGKQGARTGVRAVGAVVQGLADGNPDQIGSKVEREAAQVEVLARQVCLDLAGIHAAQQAISAAIPAFSPYANVDAQDADDCHRSP